MLATSLPTPIQDLVDRLGLTEQADPNPTPRPGNRATHTTAIRRWEGGRVLPGGGYLDDGYDLIGLLPWRPNADYGDWPMVVEWLRAFDVGGGDHRFFRITYLEGSVYLAQYDSSEAMLADAWKHGG